MAAVVQWQWLWSLKRTITGSIPASAPESCFVLFFPAFFFWKFSKFFCRIYSVGKGRPAAGSTCNSHGDNNNRPPAWLSGISGDREQLYNKSWPNIVISKQDIHCWCTLACIIIAYNKIHMSRYIRTGIIQSICYEYQLVPTHFLITVMLVQVNYGLLYSYYPG